MHRFSRCFALLVLGLAFLLPTLTAQDKKDPEKKDPTAKKEETKKDAKGDDAKKDAKDAKSKADPKKGKEADPEEKVVYGQKLYARIKSFNNETGKGLTIALPDPKRIYEFNAWKNQQTQAIFQDPNLITRAQKLTQYNADLPREQAKTFGKDLEVRPAANMIVRSDFLPPADFDDKGNPKKWTQKEITALRGNRKLPGNYKSDFEALRPGQLVDVYFAKV